MAKLQRISSIEESPLSRSVFKKGKKALVYGGHVKQGDIIGGDIYECPTCSFPSTSTSVNDMTRCGQCGTTYFKSAALVYLKTSTHIGPIIDLSKPTDEQEDEWEDNVGVPEEFSGEKMVATDEGWVYRGLPSDAWKRKNVEIPNQHTKPKFPKVSTFKEPTQPVELKDENLWPKEYDGLDPDNKWQFSKA